MVDKRNDFQHKRAPEFHSQSLIDYIGKKKYNRFMKELYESAGTSSKSARKPKSKSKGGSTRKRVAKKN